MVLNPHIQIKAQQEIDRVLNNSRLPTFDDLPSLPYVDAIVKEALRWNPVVPLGDFFLGVHIVFTLISVTRRPA